MASPRGLAASQHSSLCAPNASVTANKADTESRVVTHCVTPHTLFKAVKSLPRAKGRGRRLLMEEEEPVRRELIVAVVFGKIQSALRLTNAEAVQNARYPRHE